MPRAGANNPAVALALREAERVPLPRRVGVEGVALGAVAALVVAFALECLSLDRSIRSRRAEVTGRVRAMMAVQAEAARGPDRCDAAARALAALPRSSRAPGALLRGALCEGRGDPRAAVDAWVLALRRENAAASEALGRSLDLLELLLLGAASVGLLSAAALWFFWRRGVATQRALRAVEAQIAQREQAEREMARQQEALRRSERLAALGTLAAGAAHEINNPLTFLRANGELLLAEVERCEALSEAQRAEWCDGLRGVLEGTRSIEFVVRGLRSFGASGAPEESCPDLREVVQFALQMVGSRLRATASVRTSLDAVPPVCGDRQRLGQVVVNLLSNAVDAVADGSPERSEVRVTLRQLGADRVELSVADTGHGMTPEVRARVFDPFFTTKPVGQGMGLGLSICQSIVSALGGTLSVESEPGRGSLFRVTLPVAPERDGDLPRRALSSP